MSGLGSEDFSWYVVHTCCRHEARVEGRLLKLGLEIFLPRYTVVSRRRDRKKLLQMPLFPGYLFIHDTLEHNTYHSVLGVPGVVRFLSFGNRLQPVPAETIASIMLALNSQRAYFPDRFLQKGKKVRVVEGPLTGVSGFIKETKTEKRTVVIEVELFHQSVAVELGNDAVEPWS
jgi:transcriptional antiterminator NusG